MLDSMDLSESRQDGVLLSLTEVGNGRGQKSREQSLKVRVAEDGRLAQRRKELRDHFRCTEEARSMNESEIALDNTAPRLNVKQGETESLLLAVDKRLDLSRPAA